MSCRFLIRMGPIKEDTALTIVAVTILYTRADTRVYVSFILCFSIIRVHFNDNSGDTIKMLENNTLS